MCQTSFNILLIFKVTIILEVFSNLHVSAATGKLVKYLPGLQHEGPLPFELETGYIGVGKNEELQIFYYFVKSYSNPAVDPLVLWMSGGPGCSSFFAFAQEFVGPVIFDLVKYNGSLPTLSLNPYSWSKISSFIFVDLPVGTGFTYASNPRANHSDSQQNHNHAFEFIHKWMIDHSEYSSNPLYIGGDSHSGFVVPCVAKVILERIEAGIEPQMNLKGYILGNALTFLPAENNYMVPEAHSKAIISEDLYESLEQNCHGEYQDIVPESKCSKEYEIFEGLIVNIYIYNIGERGSIKFKNNITSFNMKHLDWGFKGHRKFNLPPNIFSWDSWHLQANYWANDDSVREALHVRKGSVGKWEYCTLRLNYTINVWDVVPYHSYLSKKGLRSLIYSGDHDMAVVPLSTQAWIKSLNYNIVSDWRQWFLNGQVAGYTRSYSNQMTYVTVKGSGHIAPLFKPAECFAMFKRWISYENL